jgi:tetrahydromethanopterin S-methyltransferase subunit C
VPPFGVPVIVNLCFWGGLYGLVFGLAFPKITLPRWFAGLLLGILAVLVGFFVVPTIKGLPIGGGWVINNWIRSILINGCFGVGVGLIYPFLAGRVFRQA